MDTGVVGELATPTKQGEIKMSSVSIKGVNMREVEE